MTSAPSFHSVVRVRGMSNSVSLFLYEYSSEGSIREQLSKSTDKLHETVSGIREVQSFMLQHIVIDDIEKRIDENITPASKKSSVVKGVMMVGFAVVLEKI